MNVSLNLKVCLKEIALRNLSCQSDSKTTIIKPDLKIVKMIKFVQPVLEDKIRERVFERKFFSGHAVRERLLRECR